ncbi:MAG: AAA family ATPase [Candidatus Spechtbacteria bacterium]|nr:AAA family ATPase [Candidatus Spechtbacteria bacterium]
MSRRKEECGDIKAFEVPLSELRWQCDEARLGFSSTADIEPLEDHVFINQPRAEDAIETGLSVPGHIFYLTSDGAITSVHLANLRRKVADRPHPEIYDILYGHNCTQPDKPKKIILEKGKGIPFATSVKKLRDALKEAIPRTLSNDECLTRRQGILEQVQAQIEEARQNFQNALDDAQFETEELGLVRFFIARNEEGRDIPDGLGSAIIQGCVVQKTILQGREALEEKDLWYPYWQTKKFAELSSDEQKNAISAKIDSIARDFKIPYVQMVAEINALNDKATEETLEARSGFVDMAFRKECADILKEYGEPVFPFIDMLREYTIERVEELFLLPDSTTQNPQQYSNSQQNAFRPDPFLPFEINVFVDNSHTTGIPIIDDRNPMYERLFGEIVSVPNAKGPHFSDHTMIRAGDLSRAEGGYLILPARALLQDASIWSRLRAVLESKRLDIGVGAWRTVTPESLPVHVRLILVGDRLAYNIFNSHPWLREDFNELFKVVAEFDRTAPFTGDTARQFAQLMKLFCGREGLPDVSSDGVAKIFEYSARQAGEKIRLLLDARSVKEILNEAGYLARQENREAPLIKGEHVARALQKRVYRVDLIREKVHQFIKDGMLLIQLEGRKKEQINGLAVFTTGDLRFAIPKRITARTYAGKRGIINIERETHLSGPVHDKGVFLFEGYLGGKYARNQPLAFSASISFEQEYEGIEGDSASSTELYAILSSLSGLPLRQDIAVTGSVNQMGEIQPIGGVNEKIEGFFDVCLMFGLTGEQGVMIPHQNIRNLMLRDDVIQAIKEGNFHVYAVRTIDEGIEILTGKKAGAEITRGEHKGQYPKGTVNYLVDQRLQQLAKVAGSN